MSRYATENYQGPVSQHIAQRTSPMAQAGLPAVSGQPGPAAPPPQGRLDLRHGRHASDPASYGP
jgi:hypothetical protein